MTEDLRFACDVDTGELDEGMSWCTEDLVQPFTFTWTAPRDQTIVDDIDLLPHGEGWLMVRLHEAMNGAIEVVLDGTSRDPDEPGILFVDPKPLGVVTLSEFDSAGSVGVGRLRGTLPATGRLRFRYLDDPTPGGTSSARISVSLLMQGGEGQEEDCSCRTR